MIDFKRDLLKTSIVIFQTHLFHGFEGNSFENCCPQVWEWTVARGRGLRATVFQCFSYGPIPRDNRWTHETSVLLQNLLYNFYENNKYCCFIDRWALSFDKQALDHLNAWTSHNAWNRQQFIPWPGNRFVMKEIRSKTWATVSNNKHILYSKLYPINKAS